MKKVFGFLLVSLLLAASLTCFAYATDRYTDGWTTVSNDTGASLTHNSEGYNATYSSNNLINGNQYVLVVVKGTSAPYTLNESTIKYINQMECASNSVSFDFIPMSTPSCAVLLCGEFSNSVESPVVLGTLVEKGVDLSGTITRQGGTATVKLYDGTDTLLGEATTDTSGAYTLTMIPEGIGYYLKVSKTGYLTYTYTGITITSESTTLPTVNISAFGGDINGDGGVYSGDFQLFLSDFNKESPTPFNYAGSDLNCDGAVYAGDFSILLAGFNKETGDAHN